MTAHHLIIGNGAAGMTAAEEIRRRSPHAAITIVGGEPCPMYSRPGLAYLLSGEIPEAGVYCRTPEDYTRLRFRFIHAHATGLDLARRAVRLADGRALAFDMLLLATGASALPAAFPGSGLEGVFCLDSLRDARELVRRAENGAQTAVVVGGGIGAMELAEGLCQRGLEVHYLLRKKTLWSTLLTEAESRILERRAIAQGIELHYEEEVAEVRGVGGRVSGVRTTAGRSIPCQVVAVATGVRPNLDLARGALQFERGIVVDEFLETSVPGVFAAGDAAQVVDVWTGGSRVNNLWSSAIAGGLAAGANMAGGRVPFLDAAPLNAARLFGVHVTVIGQVGANEDDALECQSRGSSEAWWKRSDDLWGSAWARDQDHSLRVVFRGERIAGAVILGHQYLADPVRDLVAHRVDASSIRTAQRADASGLELAVRRVWEQWRRARPEGLT